MGKSNKKRKQAGGRDATAAAAAAAAAATAAASGRGAPAAAAAAAGGRIDDDMSQTGNWHAVALAKAGALDTPDLTVNDSVFGTESETEGENQELTASGFEDTVQAKYLSDKEGEAAAVSTSTPIMASVRHTRAHPKGPLESLLLPSKHYRPATSGATVTAVSDTVVSGSVFVARIPDVRPVAVAVTSADAEDDHVIDLSLYEGLPLPWALGGMSATATAGLVESLHLPIYNTGQLVSSVESTTAVTSSTRQPLFATGLQVSMPTNLDKGLQNMSAQLQKLEDRVAARLQKSESQFRDQISAMTGLFDALEERTEAGFRVVYAEVHAEIGKVRSDVRADIGAVREAVRADNDALREAVRADIRAEAAVSQKGVADKFDRLEDMLSRYLAASTPATSPASTNTATAVLPDPPRTVASAVTMASPGAAQNTVAAPLNSTQTSSETVFQVGTGLVGAAVDLEAPVALSGPSPSAPSVVSAPPKSAGAKLDQLKLHPFRGDPKREGKKVEGFLRQFHDAANVNDWPREQWVHRLSNALQDEAAGVLSLLPQQPTFEQLVKLLRERFSSSASVEVYQSQLRARIRRDGETLVEYSQELVDLSRKAYPDFDETHRSQMLVGNFCQGLSDRMRVHVYTFPPSNLAAAVSMAQAYENAHVTLSTLSTTSNTSSQQAAPRKVRALNLEEEDGDDAHPDTPAKKGDGKWRRVEDDSKTADLSKRLNKMDGKVDQLIAGMNINQPQTSSSKQGPQSQSPRGARGSFRRQNGEHRGRACFLCGSEDHFQRECPVKAVAEQLVAEQNRAEVASAGQKNGSGQGSVGQTRGQQPGAKH